MSTALLICGLAYAAAKSIQAMAHGLFRLLERMER